MSEALAPRQIIEPSAGKTLRLTPLFALHRELGAKLVPFAAYEMPLHYAGGIVREHNHVRSAAGLFEVSHMGQARLEGRDIAAMGRPRWKAWRRAIFWASNLGGCAIRSFERERR